MAFPNVLQWAIRGLLDFVDRHRGMTVFLASLVALAAGTFTVGAHRPPLLAPAVVTVTGTFMSALSQPLKVSRFTAFVRGSSPRIMDLELKLVALQEAARENVRLRAMLGYRPPEGFLSLPGRVVGLDLDPLRGMAWVNLGRGHGLHGGEAVVTVDGVVGVVAEVHAQTSLVRLLRNGDVSVSVRDTRTRELGILAWDPAGRRFRLEDIARSADVAMGDTLVSSGLGGVFPGSLPVGRIVEVQDNPDRLLKDIWVDPFGTFFRLEEIFVLQSWSVPVRPSAAADTLRGVGRGVSPGNPG